MGIWILTVLLGLTVVVIGVLASYGFMSGHELYEQGSFMKWKLMHRPLRLRVLDIDPKPSEIDGETYYLIETQSWSVVLKNRMLLKLNKF